MRKLFAHRPSASMIVALIALSVALGGTGYAAIRLPKNSVGGKQIKRNAVTTTKVKNSTLRGSDVRNEALTGADVADGSIGSGDVTDNSLQSLDVLDNSLTGGDVQDGSLTGADVQDGSIGRQDVAGGSFLGGTMTVERLDLPLPDGSTATGSVGCPAGKTIVGGSVNISDAGSADVNITVSRPAGDGDSLPESGQGFDRWRGAAHNPGPGGTAATTMRVWAICAG